MWINVNDRIPEYTMLSNGKMKVYPVMIKGILQWQNGWINELGNWIIVGTNKDLIVLWWYDLPSLPIAKRI